MENCKMSRENVKKKAVTFADQQPPAVATIDEKLKAIVDAKMASFKAGIDENTEKRIAAADEAMKGVKKILADSEKERRAILSHSLIFRDPVNNPPNIEATDVNGRTQLTFSSSED